MRKRFTLLLSLLVLLAVSMQARYAFEVDGIYYGKYIDTVDSVYVTYKGENMYTPSYSGEVTIPATVEYNGHTYKVMGIGSCVFFDCKVTKVNLPESLYVLEPSAFWNCTTIGEITLPDGLAVIGGSAFMGCTNLTTLNMGNNVKKIYGYAFYGTQLKHIKVPKTVDCVTGETFTGMERLEAIDVDDENANYCSIDGVLYVKDKSELLAVPVAKLNDYAIPDFVEKLGGNVFYGSAAEEINIPASVTDMSLFTFNNMPNLKNVNVAEGNTKYHDEDGVLFESASKELMFYPRGRTETSYSVPEGTLKVGNLSVAFCYNLQEVTIPGSVECIGDSAFHCCFDMQQVHFNEGNLKQLGEHSFGGCKDMESFTIPNTVTHLDFGVLESCYDLKKLVIGSSVELIGAACFCNDEDLRDVYVLNPVPPTFEDKWNKNFGDKTYTEGTLYVPVGCVEAYRNSPEWKNFKNIVEGQPLGVKTPVASIEPFVRVIGGKVVVDNLAEGSKVSVYDSLGHCIYLGTDNTVELPGNGIYVVKAGSTTTKVMR